MQIDVCGSRVDVRQHPEFGYYATSEDGRVFTRPAERLPGDSRNGPWRRANHWKEVSQFTVQPKYTPPYRKCRITQDGKTKLVSVHRFMLECWVGVMPRAIVTRHLDGNSLHNVLSNLKYSTVKENVDDAFRHTGNYAAGEKNGHAKLRRDDVAEIRTRYDSGETAWEIAKSYPFVAYETVLSAAIRKTWKNVA